MTLEALSNKPTDIYYLKALSKIKDYSHLLPDRETMRLYHYDGLSLDKRKEQIKTGKSLYAQEIDEAVKIRDPIVAQYYNQRYEEITGENYLVEQLLHALHHPESEPNQIDHCRQNLTIIGMTNEDIRQYCVKKMVTAMWNRDQLAEKHYFDSIALLYSC